ncbi:MAG: tyrosine-type recombinase/integrase [Polyangiaceae bacterium]
MVPWWSGQTNGEIFLTEHGEKISLDHLTETMRQYIEAAEVGKCGAVHIFRHSMATGLLEGGADLRVIREIPGHRKLDATEIEGGA